jgi:geranylgeranyl diphosphate synthase type II
LLTDAFALMAKTAEYGIPAERTLCAIGMAAQAAGSPGMVGGQYLDMRYTARPGVTLEDLAAMHAMKTGAMLRVACEAGAVLAGADGAVQAALRAYGSAIGAAFQITDDILDEVGDEKNLGKPVGSDAALGKNTYPSLVGLQASREMALVYVEKATEALRAHTGEAADLLRGLAAYMANRIS